MASSTAGEAKLNVDGAFTSKGVGAGMVLRGAHVNVIFTVFRSIENYSDATKFELVAIEKGLKLALHWTTLPIRVETDCT
jgi:hypothetical protein